jgi:putative peptidoglycan lipid II flippase
MASSSLAAYGFGLLGHMMVKVLAPGYFARQDMKTPVRFGVFALGANIFLNFALVWEFKHVGLAMATSLSAFLNASLLLFGLIRIEALRVESEWVLFLMKVSGASLFMLFVLYIMIPDGSFWFTESLFLRITTLFVVCFAGALSYFAVLFCFGVRFKELVR